MANDAPALKLNLSYFFSGYMGKVDGAGNPIPQDKSLRPIQNIVVITGDTGKDRDHGDLQTWKTDAKGLLQPFRPGVARSLPVAQRFIFPPTEVLLQAWAAAGDEGPEKLAEVLKQYVAASGEKSAAGKPGSTPSTGGVGVELKRQRILKSQLSEPVRKSESEAEKEYVKFYDALTDDASLYGFVLPKVRAVLMKATQHSIEGARIEVHRPDGTVIRKEVSRGGAVLYAKSDAELPAGVYRFVVRPAEFNGTWNKAVVKARSYELTEALRFEIKNFAGEFDIVSIDPITVEEALLLQYAALFPWHASEAKRSALYPDMPKFEVGGKDVSEALKGLRERIGWAHSKTSLVMKVGKLELPKPKEFIDFLYERVEGEQIPELRDAKAAIDLAFGAKENVGKWGEICKKLLPSTERIGKLAKADVYLLRKSMKSSTGLAKVASNVLEKGIGLVKDVKLGVAESAFTDMQVAAQRAVASRFEGRNWAKVPDLLAQVEFGLKMYDLVMLCLDTDDAYHAAAVMQERYQDLAKQVSSKLDGAASREAIGNLELVRNQTIVLGQAATVEAAKNTLSMAMKVIGMGYPLAETLVNAVGFVNEHTIVPAVEFVDRTLMNGELEAASIARGQIAAIYTSTRHNWNAVLDRLEHPPEVQFRLRAELLTGLMGLLTHAAARAKDEAEYLTNVKKYRVQEYIQKFLLDGEGWPCPVQQFKYFGMDDFWMHGNGWSSHANVEHVPAGFPPTMDPHSPQGQQLLAKSRPERFHRAALGMQRTFPIHLLESPSVEALAKAFRYQWPPLKEKSIAYTCMYTRPRGSDSDEAWRPLQAVNGKMPSLSPLDPVRILVVLEEGVEDGIYALSVQLYRSDLHIDGPLYRLTMHRLGQELLGPEKGFQGRIGCVFVPFYDFAGSVRLGTKPLVKEYAESNQLPLEVAPGGRKRIPGGVTELLAREQNRKALEGMTYQYRVKLLGHRKVDIPIAFRGEVGDAAAGQIPVALGHDPLEKAMAANPVFLKHLGSDRVLPELFKSHTTDGMVLPCDLGGLCFRVGGRGYVIARQGAPLKFAQFDWSARTELVVSIWCREIGRDRWEAEALDWRHVPGEIELIARGEGITDLHGPKYPIQLEYVGTLDLGGTARLRPDPKTGLSFGVRTWVQDMEKTQWSEYARSLPSDGPGHLFAAHVQLAYVAPNGADIKGIRPFGHLPRDFYRIKVAVKTTAASGMDAVNFAEVHFQAPPDYTSNVPWATGNVPDSLGGTNRAIIEDWILEHPALLNASLDLLAKASEAST